MAEWWMLAAARRGWILTRGSSFGLSAAARGSLLTAAYPHPFCRTEHTRVAPLSPHARPVYTVHEHKVRQQLAYFRLLCSVFVWLFVVLHLFASLRAAKASRVVFGLVKASRVVFGLAFRRELHMCRCSAE